MRQGQQSLTSWAQEIERQSAAKRDFQIAASRASMSLIQTEHGALPVLDVAVPTVQPMPLRKLAHDQLAAELEIPRSYYQRMQDEQPELLVHNVNAWLAKSTDRRLVRTLDSNVRAILSDRYRTLDNEDVVQFIAPVLQSIGGDLKVLSCDVTETRLYLKVGHAKLRGEVKVGDEVEMGLIVTNSEVGSGALAIKPFLNRLVCLNGMVVDAFGTRRAHIGRRFDFDGDLTAGFEVDYSDDTRATNDTAIMLKVRDTVQQLLTPAGFQRILDSLKTAATSAQLVDPAASVEVVRKRLSLSQGEGNSVLRQLALGGDLTAWGMANAVTRIAEDADNYDRATELERAGHKVIEMALVDGGREWQAVAVAQAA